ncbi:hypothetical protein LTR08_007563 [Meristemomyces frigidus]|nr:hypothetical protein LTR08_007563 [Meristemomyces frigidus]
MSIIPPVTTSHNRQKRRINTNIDRSSPPARPVRQSRAGAQQWPDPQECTDCKQASSVKRTQRNSAEDRVDEKKGQRRDRTVEIMAHSPAVIIIARHGPRLDAADQSWHLSTPTPYDPPLTYGGWNQSRALGVRIASLLHAREQAVNETSSDSDGVTAQGANDPQTKKRKRRHKVVIHSSPFLRCVQTSVAIAAGMGQFQPPAEAGNRPSANARTRAPNSMHSASPRLRALEGAGAGLAPLNEPKRDFAHTIARRALHEHKRHRKAKMRVDAFLGEWLNPSYFDHITPPPPSTMMIATAKAALMQNEPVDVFTPTISTRSTNSSLWGGHTPRRQNSSESALDDMGDTQDAPRAHSPARSRNNSFSSIGSNDSASASGIRSPFRPNHGLQRAPSTLPKPETTVYVPPTPEYAISSSDHIPRGYVTHARHACVNVDYQWDSSRPPQFWDDGGEYGEEWSAMHKRFRRGLNHLIYWYSQHDADDRAEDSLSLDQAEKHEDEEPEELVVVLVTHGAGCNALIGALTGQPVLLDVGMASLTMAVRRDDAPSITTYASSTMPSADASPSHTPAPEFMHARHPRRGSMDLGLSSVYEMSLVSSMEHLRPGADPTRLAIGAKSGNGVGGQYRQRLGSSHQASARGVMDSGWNMDEPARNSTSTALGSILRHSATHEALQAAGLGGMGRTRTAHTVPHVSTSADTPGPSPPYSPCLWTPAGSRTPLLPGMKTKEERKSVFSQLNDASNSVSPGQDLVLDFSNSPPDSRPGSSGGTTASEVTLGLSKHMSAVALNGGIDGASDKDPKITPSQNGHAKRDSLSAVAESPPQALSRTLSQKGLWGTKPAGVKVMRKFGMEPKRRWTVTQKDRSEVD